MSSSFVWSMRSIGPASPAQTRQTSSPAQAQMRNDVCSVRSSCSSSPRPRLRAMATFTPAPMPISSPVKSETSSVVEPTAPRATYPANLPAMATSLRLKSTSSTCVSISGRLKRRIFRQRDPVVISMERGWDGLFLRMMDSPFHSFLIAAFPAAVAQYITDISTKQPLFLSYFLMAKEGRIMHFVAQR